jgi:1,4-dihydroxy-2-naphthoate octaprenyltransferase
MVNKWILGARPRTLPAAVVPVVVGLAVAIGVEGAQWLRAGLALVVSLLLQVGVNYANDYSDGVRGTDEVRVGPQRLVGSGLATPRSVKVAAFLCFGLAAVVGLALALMTSLWVIPVGLAAVLAGWFYTGGKNPYGYIGLGEVFVFVFFGLVATVGTTYVILEKIPAMAWLQGIATGCLACALLVINNLRDIPTDRLVGKRTLAVRLGDQRTRILFISLILLGIGCGAVAAVSQPWSLIVLLCLFPAVQPLKSVRRGASGHELIAVLGSTGQLQIVFGALTLVSFLLNN